MAVPLAGTLSATAGRRRLRARRVALAVLVFATVAAVALRLAAMLWENGTTAIELAILALSTVLLVPIALSFWMAVFGFLVELRGVDPLAIDLARIPVRGPALARRTAIVMPVYDEEPARVLAGLRTSYESLEATGRLADFDFFVLSDTLDPQRWLDEEVAFTALRDELSRPEQLFYRNRAHNVDRKAGNIADFCERWGGKYECMIVLDADSVMSGATVVKLARAMARHPDVGIIQVPPVPVNALSLFGRLQQFAARVYGPTWAAGLAWISGGEGNYYGHNAILRVAPFVEHCRLPRLSGEPPLGGPILSHDFVEAALMRRAGHRTHLAVGLGGSFEECPRTLIDWAARDRRWCQGNLQHARLIGMPGLHPMNRAHLALGVMAYASAPVWLLLLVLWTAESLRGELVPHRYFPPGGALFPVWEISTRTQAEVLLGVLLALLFVPRALAIVSRLRDRRERAGFGGAARLLASVALECVLSTLFAPVLMLEHSRFVTSILLGRSVGWNAQPRDERGVGLREAVRRHGTATLLGALWLVLLVLLAPRLLWWMMPVLAGMLLAIPLSIFSSRTDAGRWALARGLFLTPDERAPEPVLHRLRQILGRGTRAAPRAPVESALERVLADRQLCALHLALQADEPADAESEREVERLLVACRLRGVDGLTPAEQRVLLRSPRALLALAGALDDRRDRPSA